MLSSGKQLQLRLRASRPLAFRACSLVICKDKAASSKTWTGKLLGLKLVIRRSPFKALSG